MQHAVSCKGYDPLTGDGRLPGLEDSRCRGAGGMAVEASDGEDGDAASGQKGHVNPWPWDPTDFRTFKNVFVFTLDDIFYLLYSAP